MKDILISHILTEPIPKIFPEYQNVDGWVTFWSFSDPHRAKSSKSALLVCEKLKYLSFKTGPIKKY